jgi:hypothetical protein
VAEVEEMGSAEVAEWIAELGIRAEEEHEAIENAKAGR